jgi:hypothetical protein
LCLPFTLGVLLRSQTHFRSFGFRLRPPLAAPHFRPYLARRRLRDAPRNVDCPLGSAPAYRRVLFGHRFELFGGAVIGDRIPNPENPGGYGTAVSRSDNEYPVVQSSLALWENPRQVQGQFNGLQKRRQGPHRNKQLSRAFSQR